VAAGSRSLPGRTDYVRQPAPPRRVGDGVHTAFTGSPAGITNGPLQIRDAALDRVWAQLMRRSFPAQYGSRSSRLSTLPVGLRGRVSTKSTDVGHL
jgi:hypothetical protein